MRRMLPWVLSVAAAALFLLPLGWMLVASFREGSAVFGSASDTPGSVWTLGNYAAAWQRAGLGSGLLVSVVQVGVIASAGLFINALAAYAFARLHFPGRDWIFLAVVTLVILPVEVLAVPLFFVARDLGLTGSGFAALAGLTVPFVSKAFNIYFLRQQFLSLPVELEEAAALDGAGPWRQFWHVALPSIRPALATVLLLDVLFHWGDFLWPLLIGTREETRTVQLSLANLFTQPPLNWGHILACAVLATLPVMALFRLLQRHLVATDARAGIK